MFLNAKMLLFSVLLSLCASSSLKSTGIKHSNEGSHDFFFDMTSESANTVIGKCLHKFRNDKDHLEILVQSSRDLTLDDYVTKTVEFIDHHLKHYVKDMTEIEGILEKIHSAVDQKTVKNLAIFTAHALCNTNVFNIFEEPGDGEYKRRGLLMIKGKKNYDNLDLITKDCFLLKNFLSHPETLAFPTYKAIYVTVKWFDLHATDNNLNLTFETSINLLHPEEWNKWNEDRSQCEEKDLKIIANSAKMYDLLFDALNK